MTRGDENDGDPYVVVEKSGGGMTSFLMGLAVGAGLALLFAPQTGTETRRFLRRKARRAGHAMQSAAEEAADGVRDQVDHAKRRVAEGIEDARDALYRERRRATDAARSGRNAARAAREELEARLAETETGSHAAVDAMRAARRQTTATAGDELDDDDKNDTPGA